MRKNDSTLRNEIQFQVYTVGVTHRNVQKKQSRSQKIATRSRLFIGMSGRVHSRRSRTFPERIGPSRKWTLEIKDQLRNVISIGMPKGRRGEPKRRGAGRGKAVITRVEQRPALSTPPNCQYGRSKMATTTNGTGATLEQRPAVRSRSRNVNMSGAYRGTLSPHDAIALSHGGNEGA